MKNITKRPHFPPNSTTIITSRNPFSPPPPDSSPQNDQNKFHCKNLKNPSFGGSGIRWKKRGSSGGKRGGPATPLLKWKFDDGDDDVCGSGENTPQSVDKCLRKVRNGGGGGEVFVSARKLAAGLWQLQLPEFDGGGGGGAEIRDLEHNQADCLGSEAGEVLVDVPILNHQSSEEFLTQTKDLLPNHLAICGPENRILYEVEPFLSFLKSSREQSTTCNSGCLKASDEVYRFYSHMKLLEDQQIANTSVVSDLQTELEQACTRIHELEMDRRSSKKKLEHFMRKLADDKASWQRKEHEKMRAMIADAKDDLKRERKNGQKMEFLNSKLVNELTEAKLSARRFKQNCEKERKERQLMEEVCDELAKELGEEKAEIEALKRESMKIREEVDDERRMLQMAEVWREERVQMKLIDAKLTLEQKYSQLNKLIVDIEEFLRLRGITPDMMDTREVELLQEASNSVNIPDMKEFSYIPQNSEDIFSIIEDVQSGGLKDRETEPCLDYSHLGHGSNIQARNAEEKGFSKNFEPRYSNGFVDQERETKEDRSGLESLSNTEDQGSSFSPDVSDASVNKNNRDSNVSGSIREWEEIAGHETPDTEISETCSVSARHLKSSSISRLWRSNPSNGEKHKMTVEGTNGRLSNARISNAGIVSPDRGSGGGLSPAEIVEVWSLPDPGNPHIIRGMKGCIEWPRDIPKNTLKAKLLEARMETKKIQLRHVLKQNM